MSLRCTEPDLQMALLSEAGAIDTLTPDLALHLEGCAACQQAVERAQRMAAVWAEDQADESAIAAAREAFEARRAAVRTVGWLDVVPFASAGIAAGYLLLAATGSIGTPWTHPRAATARSGVAIRTNESAVGHPVASNPVVSNAPRSAPVFATTEETVKLVRARPHVETSHGVAPLVDGLRLQLKRGESARITLNEGHATSVEGPCLVEIWSAPMEASGWRMIREETAEPPTDTREAPITSSAPSPLAAPSGSTVARSRSLADGMAATRDLAPQDTNAVSARAWARAAAALRDDDFDAADRAFDELGHSSEPATRDAARLARAQLWISRGREAAVRPVLEQLAQNGTTALVRQRAAEFLTRSNH